MVKICILIIYSKNTIYDEMLEIQRNYLNNFQNEVTFYFIQMNNEITNELEITDDFIFVKGDECFLNILKKTVVSMRYVLENHKFDFLIRTNISTILSIKKLTNFLSFIPKNNYYGSGIYLNLQNIAHPYGVVDDSLFGTIYGQGTCIILSNDIVKNICNNSDKLRYDIVDDLSIGVYLNTIRPGIVEYSSEYQPSMFNSELQDIKNISNNYIIYRNRTSVSSDSETRCDDIVNMRFITRMLLQD
jgi:hypothetical protein